MEINQLRYFIQTAQMENMSKAARILNISQPTLSKSIAALEKELGTTLFDRSGRKLILNERGRRFLVGAMQSMQELDSAVEAAKDSLISSTLNIGMFCISDRFLKCISCFREKNPDIVIKIKYLTDLNIDTNKYDTLLYPRSSQFKRYRGEVLYRDNYRVALPSCEMVSNPVRLESLTKRRMVMLKHGPMIYEPAYHLVAGLGVRDEQIIFTNSSEIHRNLISRGAGIGFVPDGNCETYELDKNIALLDIMDDPITQEIMVGFKREKHLSQCGKSFADFMENFFLK